MLILIGWHILVDVLDICLLKPALNQHELLDSEAYYQPTPIDPQDIQGHYFCRRG